MSDFTELVIAGRTATPEVSDWGGANAILPPEVCARLAEVKRHWDPEGRIVGNHAVSPTAA